MQEDTLCRLQLPETRWERVPNAEAVDLPRRGNFADDGKHGSTLEVKCGDCDKEHIQGTLSATAMKKICRPSSKRSLWLPFRKEWNSSALPQLDIRPHKSRGHTYGGKPDQLANGTAREPHHEAVTKDVTNKSNNNKTYRESLRSTAPMSSKMYNLDGSELFGGTWSTMSNEMCLPD